MLKTEPAIRIIGIDPGTRFTGIGIIDRTGNKLKFVHSETINTANEEDLSHKLAVIFLRITDVITQFKPHEGAVEKVFHSVNPRSSLLLGHARGVTILAMQLKQLSINDYAPNEVKSAVTGAGKAGKEQVAAMVQVLLNLDRKIRRQEDETDALAVAICHANTQSFAQRKIS